MRHCCMTLVPGQLSMLQSGQGTELFHFFTYLESRSITASVWPVQNVVPVNLNLDKRVLQSLDFTMNRFFMKLFRTSNIETVLYCQTVFGCELPSALLVKRYDKFIEKLACTSV